MRFPIGRLVKSGFVCALLALSSCDNGGASTESNKFPTGGGDPLPAPKPLSLGLDASDTLKSGQTLLYVFSATSGTRYELALASTSVSKVEFRDSISGELLASKFDSLGSCLIGWTSTRTTRVVVGLVGKVTTLPSPVSLSLVAVPAGKSGLGKSIHDARDLGFDSTGFTIFLDKGDTAWFRVPLPAGKPVRITGWVHQSGLLRVFNKDSLPLGSEEYHQLLLKSSDSKFGYVRIRLKTPTDTGTVTLQAWLDTLALDAYEPDDTISKATLIPTDGSIQNHILQTDEVDWFKFEAKQGKTYRIATPGNLNSTMSLYGDSLANSYLADSMDSLVLYRATYSGLIYFRVNNAFLGLYTFDGGSPYSISISLDSSQWDAYEPDDAPSTATYLKIGAEPQKHYMEGGESDWFKFDLDSGNTYQPKIDGRTTGNVNLYLDSMETTSWLRGSSDFASFKVTKSGRYFLQYTSWRSSDSGAYGISIGVDTAHDAYEPNDARSQAALVEVGDVRGGRLPANDVDWYKFAVDSGKTYSVSLYGLTNAYMSLFPDSIAETDYEGGWTSVSLFARKSGEFFFSLHPSSPEYTGAYLLSIKATP